MPANPLQSPCLPIVPSLSSWLNNPSVRLFSAFLLQDSPSDHGGQSPNQNDCGTWVRNINGGVFTSPNYPNTYPPNKECVYILEGKAGSFFSFEHFIFHSIAVVVRTADTVPRLSAYSLLQWMSLVWLTLFYITSPRSDFPIFCFFAGGQSARHFSEGAILSLFHPTDNNPLKMMESGTMWVAPDFWLNQCSAMFISIGRVCQQTPLMNGT